jgi:DNA-binding SARP family transcriptional activator
VVTDFVEDLVAGESGPATPVLRLFGEPRVISGDRVLDVPESSKRLVAYVALHRGRVERRHAARVLWPTVDELRAAGNLRSALWRLNRAGVDVVTSDVCHLALRDTVLVDAHVVERWAGRVVGHDRGTGAVSTLPCGIHALELLPGWYDDWVQVERERMRQRTLAALERLSRNLMSLGRCADAVEAAVMAVTIDPLRESAQRVLLEAHLAEGNWVEGRRSLRAYRDLLRRELGTEPHPGLARLLHDRLARGLRSGPPAGIDRAFVVQ